MPVIRLLSIDRAGQTVALTESPPAPTTFTPGGVGTLSRFLYSILRLLLSGGVFVQERHQIRESFSMKLHARRVELSLRARFVDEMSVSVLASHERRAVPLGELLARLWRHVAYGDANPSII